MTDEQIARGIAEQIIHATGGDPKRINEAAELIAMMRRSAGLAERERCAKKAVDRANSLREAEKRANAMGIYQGAARLAAAASHCEQFAVAIRETDSDA